MWQYSNHASDLWETADVWHLSSTLPLLLYSTCLLYPPKFSIFLFLWIEKHGESEKNIFKGCCFFCSVFWKCKTFFKKNQSSKKFFLPEPLCSIMMSRWIQRGVDVWKHVTARRSRPSILFLKKQIWACSKKKFNKFLTQAFVGLLALCLQTKYWSCLLSHLALAKLYFCLQRLPLLPPADPWITKKNDLSWPLRTCSADIITR